MERVSLRRNTDLLRDRHPRGPELFVDTGFGGDGRDGKSWKNALDTLQEAFDRLAAAHTATPGSAAHATIRVLGDIREEVIAPLGAYGLRIVGGFIGRPRHVTSGGTFLVGNGASLREPASGATSGGALLTLREHGCIVENLMVIPKSDATGIRLRRAEDATYPDASHAIIRGCRIGLGTLGTSKGIEDHGGCSHVTIEDCELEGLAEAIGHTTGAGIAAPNRYWILRNWLSGNTDHIDLPCDQGVIRDNILATDASGENLAVDGGLSGFNRVLFNVFPTAAASVTIANGYKPGTSDIWRNYVSDTAAFIVTVPT